MATASLVGVGFTIHLAAVSTGWLRLMLIAVAVVTIAISWMTLNVIYVLRYVYLFSGLANGGIDFGDADTQARTTG